MTVFAICQERMAARKANWRRPKLAMLFLAFAVAAISPTASAQVTSKRGVLAPSLESRVLALGPDAVKAWNEGAVALNSLGLAYARGANGKAFDHGRASVLFEAACQGGVADACAGLAYLYDTGSGVRENAAEAVRLNRKACDGGNALSCSNLGMSYYRGRGVTRDDVQAVRWYRKACDGGNAGGCSNLGFMYRSGLGVPRDELEASRLYRRACDWGYADGCTNLNSADLNRQGDAKIDADALAGRLRNACDGGEYTSCHNLGVMIAEARVAGADEADPYRLFQKACNGGLAHSCTNLANMHELGRGAPRDDGEALRLYRKGCTGGSAPACVVLRDRGLTP